MGPYYSASSVSRFRFLSLASPSNRARAFCCVLPSPNCATIKGIAKTTARAGWLIPKAASSTAVRAALFPTPFECVPNERSAAKIVAIDPDGSLRFSRSAPDYAANVPGISDVPIPRAWVC